MKPNRLKERMLAKDPTLLNGWLTLGSVAAAELMSRQAWDALTIDMQHGLADFDTTLNMLRAISSTEVTPMVRVPWLDPALIMRVLDAGAYGVICPMINTRAQCEEFVACCRYAPQGARSSARPVPRCMRGTITGNTPTAPCSPGPWWRRARRWRRWTTFCRFPGSMVCTSVPPT